MHLRWILASLVLRTGIPLCVFSRQTPLFHFAQSEWVEDHLFVTSTSFALKGDECSGGLKRKNKHFLAFFPFSFTLCKCWRDNECKQEGTNLTSRSVESCLQDVLDFKNTRRCAEEDDWWGGVGQRGLSAPPPPSSQKKQNKKTSFCQLCFFLIAFIVKC